MDLVGCPQVSLDCGTFILAWPGAPPSQAWHRNKVRGGTVGGRVVCVSTEITLGCILGQYSDPLPHGTYTHTHISVPHALTHTGLLSCLGT